MIVIPQLFNYRLIIGSLVIAIVVLGSYSFSSYSTLKDHQEFIEQEKKLVENELSEMISLYDDVVVGNEKLNEQLEESKFKVNSILDSLRILKANVSLITKYRIQLASLQKEKQALFATISQLEEENIQLKQTTDQITQQLQEQSDYIAALESKEDPLEEEKKEVSFSINNIKANALKYVNKRKSISTKKAKRANQLEVSFSLANESLEEIDEEELYIQILDPNNNVVADKGIVRFGDSSLIYSEKTIINQLDENLDVKTIVSADSKEPLIKGTYFVSIFHQTKMLGSTIIELN